MDNPSSLCSISGPCSHVAVLSGPFSFFAAMQVFDEVETLALMWFELYPSSHKTRLGALAKKLGILMCVSAARAFCLSNLFFFLMQQVKNRLTRDTVRPVR